MSHQEETARCAELAAADPEIPSGLYVCRCDHEHAPDQIWCYICEYPTPEKPATGGGWPGGTGGMQPARAQSRAEGLAAFLAARLDEVERNARDALALWPDTHFTVDPGSLVIVGFHRRHDPGRVLREVAAKRAILDRHVSAARTSSRSPACRECDDELRGAWPCPTIRHLAAVDSDHPGYLQEWKP